MNYDVTCNHCKKSKVSITGLGDLPIANLVVPVRSLLAAAGWVVVSRDMHPDEHYCLNCTDKVIL